MFLTKSLFVEFVQSPKWAWWHVHDKEVYSLINAHLYGAMDGFAIGKAVEDEAKKLFADRDVVTINKNRFDYSRRHQSYNQQTMQFFQDGAAVIYQGGFFFEDVFVICDLLVLNNDGKYDLYEVKSKNSIRKNTEESKLYTDLQADLGIQKHVLEQVLGDKFSGCCNIIYLNRNYVKNGPILPDELLLQEDVTEEVLSSDEVVSTLAIMRSDLSLSEGDFNQKHPWNGDDYMTYYGHGPELESIWSIPNGWEQRKILVDQNKTMISDLEEEDFALFVGSNGDESRASRFLELWKEGEEIIDEGAIKQMFAGLQFPLYFYDYETVSWPVPLFDGTKPWQQVVVQYSLHILDKNGELTHKQGLIDSSHGGQGSLVTQLLEDLNYGQSGNYIVWYKYFENGRNDEMARMYPDYEQYFSLINDRTFDLMDVFKSFAYFHRGFGGSCSLKKVLPVITDLSYDTLSISDGGNASDTLVKMLRGEKNRDMVKDDLLEYCYYDTLAMVKIYQVILSKLS